MRVTILTQYYHPEIGAAQVRLGAFAQALKQHGHAVQVVTAMPNYPAGVVQAGYQGKFWLQEHVDGIPVTRTWVYPATGRNVLKRLLNYFSFTLSSLFALALVPRADILFVESPPLFLCLSAWLMARLRRQKLCMNISDLWPDSVVALGIMREGLFVRAARWLELWLYRQSWRVCSVTQGIIETLVAEKGVDRDKIRFLPNGVDVERFAPQPADQAYKAQLGLAGKQIFAYTGTHGYAQGLDIMLNAAARLRDQPEIALVFVGEGPEKVRLQAEAERLRLDNVTFVPALPTAQMPRLFGLVTACIVPLRDVPLFRDARPSKIFPPLACGKPIIYSGAGEGAGLIEQAGCGLVTPPEDADALARAVAELAATPDAAEAMGRRGRSFVREQLSWSAIVATWLEELGE